ncbi:MAG: glycosyltransferase [Firmicutes bacterium]|nr:glycosyltransferase [Bacillota bacterium]
MSAPRVTVLVVVRNEAAALDRLLESLMRQTLPPEEWEWIVVDGLSEDGSRAVAERWAARCAARGGPAALVLENPGRILASGWNIGLRAARAPVVLRLDAHAAVPPDFLERSLAALDARREAWAAGGVLRTVGRGYWGRVNAVVLSHPFGVGDSPFRVSAGARARRAGAGEPRWADTAPYAAYRRWVFERVGYFREALRRNEDLELHARVRAAGGRFWLDPSIVVEYEARPTLRGLLQKAWGDGFWSVRAWRLQRGAFRPRHLAPPVFAAAILLALGALLWPAERPAGAALLLAYCAAVLVAAAHAAARAGDPRLFPGLCLAFPAFHLTRGLASLVSLALRWRADPPGRPAARDPFRAAVQAGIVDAPGESWYGPLVSRRVSHRISRWLVRRTRVTANQVTAAMVAAGAVGVALFAGRPPLAWLLGAALLHAWLILDAVDGEVARGRGATSAAGVYLDHVGHYLVNPGLLWALWMTERLLPGEARWALGTAGFAAGVLSKAVGDAAAALRLHALEARHRRQAEAAGADAGAADGAGAPAGVGGGAAGAGGGAPEPGDGRLAAFRWLSDAATPLSALTVIAVWAAVVPGTAGPFLAGGLAGAALTLVHLAKAAVVFSGHYRAFSRAARS